MMFVLQPYLTTPSRLPSTGQTDKERVSDMVIEGGNMWCGGCQTDWLTTMHQPLHQKQSGEICRGGLGDTLRTKSGL